MASFVRSDLFRNFVGGFVVGALGFIMLVPEAQANFAAALQRIIA